MAIDSAANHMVGAEATTAGFVISTLTGGEDFALQIGSLTETLAAVEMARRRANSYTRLPYPPPGGGPDLQNGASGQFQPPAAELIAVPGSGPWGLGKSGAGPLAGLVRSASGQGSNVRKWRTADEPAVFAINNWLGWFGAWT